MGVLRRTNRHGRMGNSLDLVGVLKCPLTPDGGAPGEYWSNSLDLVGVLRCPVAPDKPPRPHGKQP